MLVLAAKGQKHGSVVAGEHERTTTPKVYGDKVRQGTTARVSEKLNSLSKAGKEKVLAVRHQLDAGKYGINERLNVAADRLIENLITKRMDGNEVKSTTCRRQK
ncbi:MAG: hypothetical protein RQ760_04855 [Sedimentisphaerales bacterium]|nr:hypothetical protein [Sedimentisphaerales bacterium]